MIRFRETSQVRDFERIILPHLDAAYSLARFLVRNEQDAQDAVQEACLRAFRFYESFRGENSRAWFLKIVRNTSFTVLQRARKNEDEVVFDEELHSPESAQLDVGGQLDRDLDRQTVRAAIEELPAEFREVITLRELEDCSYKEIADIANIPVGTVMSRLARARRQLYLILSKNFPDATK
jgi:RNA polymerase sigma-70 factor (ECF subfamily)